jgi:hypothetical protein
MDPEMVRQQRLEEALSDNGEAPPPEAGVASAPLVARAFLARRLVNEPVTPPESSLRGDAPPPDDCSQNIRKTPVESRGVLVIPPAVAASPSRPSTYVAVYWLSFFIFIGLFVFEAARTVGLFR